MTATALEPSERIGLLARLPLHPVLLAAWPALTLWSSNADEVRTAEAVPLVWIPALAAVIATAALTLLFRRDPRRAGIVVAGAAVVALIGGRVLGSFGLAGNAVVVVVVAILLGLVARRIGDDAVGGVTSALNVLAVVLVVLTLPAIVPNLGAEGGAAAMALEAEGGSGSDIWYVVPDRYPRADVLAEVFDHDNEPFLDALRDRGFDIGEDALANYPKTAHSLASTWNLDYLDELVDLEAAGEDGDDWGPLYALLRDHRLGRTLQDAGYDYTHLGTWWSPTAVATTADVNLRLDARSEFAGVYLAGTLFEELTDPDDTPGATGTEIREGLADLNHDYSAYQYDTLDRLARQDASDPRFVLAHITQPHEPYVFAADGTRVTRDQARQRSREENLVNQLEYFNDRLLATIDTIIDRDPDAVIVIQSDEGPHPEARTGSDYDWTSASDDTLEEKLRIISAVRLPGGPDLPDDRTAVNTWRWILNETVGTDLETLDDRVAVFPGEDALYTLVDVTDRVS